MGATEIIGIAETVLSALAFVVGLLIKSEMAKMRIKSLEDDIVLREWVRENFVSHGMWSEYRRDGGRP